MLDQGIISTFRINYIKWKFNDNFDKLEENEALTVTEAWNKYTILSCIKIIALSDVKSSALNAC